VRKVKIVHVTQSLGGVKTYLEHLFTHYDPDNFEHVIIAPENSSFQKFCKKNSVIYHPLKFQRSINLFKDISILFKVISILKKEAPALVHAHSAKGGYIGRLAAKFVPAKVIYSPHAFSYLSFKGLKRTVFYMLEYIAGRFTSKLLAVSHSEASRAVNELGYKPNEVKVILNSIPINDDLPFRNYTNCINIGMIGRLTYQKNPLLFLEVAVLLLRKYPHLKFSILGAGVTDHLSAEIAEYIKMNGLEGKVNILKWGNNNTSKRFLDDMDIFVLTSVFEGLPFSLVEAMASGVPCVVSKVDGNTDVINNNENGFSCLSADEFYTKLDLLVKSEELRRKFGQAGYRYIKSMHDIQKNIKQLEDLYRQQANRDTIIPLRGRKRDKASNETGYRNVSPNI
jgi:glycosyltransferase involved in cell wall biosynthesis